MKERDETKFSDEEWDSVEACLNKDSFRREVEQSIFDRADINLTKINDLLESDPFMVKDNVFKGIALKDEIYQVEDPLNIEISKRGSSKFCLPSFLLGGACVLALVAGMVNFDYVAREMKRSKAPTYAIEFDFSESITKSAIVTANPEVYWITPNPSPAPEASKTPIPESSQRVDFNQTVEKYLRDANQQTLKTDLLDLTN